jgi:Ca2+-binding RTX toxin-like protein
MLALLAIAFAASISLAGPTPTPAQVSPPPPECSDTACALGPALTVSLASGELIAEDTLGVRNNATIEVDWNAASQVNKNAMIYDQFGVEAGAGCVQLTLSRAYCAGAVDFVNADLWFGDDRLVLRGIGNALFDAQALLGPGNDSMATSAPRGAVIDGESGNDLIGGSDRTNGDDLLTGGDGDDWIIGWRGNDGIWGDAGNDEVYGGSGEDDVLGGTGNDLVGGAEDRTWIDFASDVVGCGAGNDSYWFESGLDFLSTSPPAECEVRL